MRAFNELMADRDELIQEYNEVLAEIADTTALEIRISQLISEQETIVAEVHRHIDRNEYNARCNELSERYEVIRAEVEQLSSELDETRAKSERLRGFMAEISRRERLITEFDEALWYATIETVLVESSEKLVFCFKNGLKTPINMG